MIEVQLFFIIFISHIIQGITGFAGTLLALPFSTKVIGYDVARSMMNMITIVSAVLIVGKSYKAVDMTIIKRIIPSMSLGLLVGIAIKATFQSNIVLKIYGVFILIVAMKGLMSCYRNPINSNHKRKPRKAQAYFNDVLLVVAGIIHALYVSGGALLIIYVATKIKDQEVFRATIAMIWIILNTSLFMIDIRGGMISIMTWRYFVVGIIPCILATYLGMRLQSKVKGARFTKLTYYLLVMSGIAVIV